MANHLEHPSAHVGRWEREKRPKGHEPRPLIEIPPNRCRHSSASSSHFGTVEIGQGRTSQGQSVSAERRHLQCQQQLAAEIGGVGWRIPPESLLDVYLLVAIHRHHEGLAGCAVQFNKCRLRVSWR